MKIKNVKLKFPSTTSLSSLLSSKWSKHTFKIKKDDRPQQKVIKSKPEHPFEDGRSEKDIEEYYPQNDFICSLVSGIRSYSSEELVNLLKPRSSNEENNLFVKRKYCGDVLPTRSQEVNWNTIVINKCKNKACMCKPIIYGNTDGDMPITIHTDSQDGQWSEKLCIDSNVQTGKSCCQCFIDKRVAPINEPQLSFADRKSKNVDPVTFRTTTLSQTDGSLIDSCDCSKKNKKTLKPCGKKCTKKDCAECPYFISTSTCLPKDYEQLLTDSKEIEFLHCKNFKACSCQSCNPQDLINKGFNIPGTRICVQTGIDDSCSHIKRVEKKRRFWSCCPQRKKKPKTKSKKEKPLETKESVKSKKSKKVKVKKPKKSKESVKSSSSDVNKEETKTPTESKDSVKSNSSDAKEKKSKIWCFKKKAKEETSSKSKDSVKRDKFAKSKKSKKGKDLGSKESVKSSSSDAKEKKSKIWGLKKKAEKETSSKSEDSVKRDKSTENKKNEKGKDISSKESVKSSSSDVKKKKSKISLCKKKPKNEKPSASKVTIKSTTSSDSKEPKKKKIKKPKKEKSTTSKESVASSASEKKEKMKKAKEEKKRAKEEKKRAKEEKKKSIAEKKRKAKESKKERKKKPKQSKKEKKKSNMTCRMTECDGPCRSKKRICCWWKKKKVEQIHEICKCIQTQSIICIDRCDQTCTERPCKRSVSVCINNDRSNSVCISKEKSSGANVRTYCLCANCGRLSCEHNCGCKKCTAGFVRNNAICLPANHTLSCNQAECLRLLIKMEAKQNYRQINNIITELNEQKSEMKKLHELYQTLMNSSYSTVSNNNRKTESSSLYHCLMARKKSQPPPAEQTSLRSFRSFRTSVSPIGHEHGHVFNYKTNSSKQAATNKYQKNVINQSKCALYNAISLERNRRDTNNEVNKIYKETKIEINSNNNNNNRSQNSNIHRSVLSIFTDNLHPENKSYDSVKLEKQECIIEFENVKKVKDKNSKISLTEDRSSKTKKNIPIYSSKTKGFINWCKISIDNLKGKEEKYVTKCNNYLDHCRNKTKQKIVSFLPKRRPGVPTCRTRPLSEL